MRGSFVAFIAQFFGSNIFHTKHINIIVNCLRFLRILKSEGVSAPNNTDDPFRLRYIYYEVLFWPNHKALLLQVKTPVATAL